MIPVFVPDSTKKKYCSGRLVLAGVAGLILSLLVLVITAREADSTVPGPAPGPTGQAGSEGRDSGTVAEAKRRILVRFRPGTEGAERIEARDAVDAEFVDSYPLVPRLQLVEIPEGADRADAMEDLEDRSEVAYAEPDLIRTLNASSPKDTFYQSNLWGLNNTGQSFAVGTTRYTGTPDADIDGPEAWDLSRGSSDVTVAVIDSGIQLDHPDLAANLWSNPEEIPGNGIDDDRNGRIDDVRGWDFVNNDNDPSDDQGHGTHVAGTIGAVGNNNRGVTGVAWNVKLMPLKACDAKGRCPLSATIAALNYAVAQGVKISNNSYGGIGGQSISERNAITAARNAGHLFVAAAGNDGLNTDLLGNAHYPSGYNLDNIVSVASTNLNDRLSSFSNWGATSVDLGAPGSQILSTYINGGYAWANGTSMASPHVAGVAALIRSRKPTWTYSQVRARLLDHTRPLTALDGKTVTDGMLNAFDALNFAPDPPTITAGPSGVSDSDAATFSFTGETVGAGTNFQCRLDLKSWESCVSPKIFTGLSDGDHTFRTRQTDRSGNISESVSRVWTVVRGDTISPASSGPGDPLVPEESVGSNSPDDPTEDTDLPSSLEPGESTSPVAPKIISGPANFVASTSASFSFTGEDSATFECRLDSGGWENCSSPRIYSNLPEGKRKFAVRQTNRSIGAPSETTWVWTVDTRAPQNLPAKAKKRLGKFWRIRIRAVDSNSGLARAAFSTRKSRPGARAKPTKVTRLALTRSSTLKIRLKARPRWVKVRDRAGNWSGWRAVRQR